MEFRASLSKLRKLSSSLGFVANQSGQGLELSVQPSIPSSTTQLAGAVPETPISARSEAMHAPEARKRKSSPSDESDALPKKKKSRFSKSPPQTPSPTIEDITS
jgi:hypothetical protein